LIGTRLAKWGAVAGLLAGSFATVAHAASGARLEGSFAMRGTLTFVDNVRGEHQGEHVMRVWTFLPRCASGACARVTLLRRRSGRHVPDSVLLRRRGPGMYRGTGRFWVSLLCAGHVIRHGGLAFEKITVRITRTVLIGSSRVATSVRARYENPRRINLTRCPGGIGRDAARYTGTRVTPPPTA
jgi:hypothetical protein